jgi:hypothetical protein
MSFHLFPECLARARRMSRAKSKVLPRFVQGWGAHRIAVPKFDCYGYCRITPGGTVDLRTGELRLGNRDDGIHFIDNRKGKLRLPA